jgi:DNA-binding response OmpR family regulator
VVTDYKLPGKTGAQLIEELRHRGLRIPVLMMSAYTDEMTIDRARAAGAWLFLPKPVPLPTLIDVFESLARRPAATLLVDDEEGLAQNLAEALTAAGHEVVVSHTVADALSHNRRLQTAVLDYRLPDGTGVDVARELRARDPSIQILFISGYSKDLGGQIGEDLGAAETLEKPVETGKVLSWVQIALEKAPR